MSNIQRLAKEGGKNHRIFADTIVTLKNSQGFYSRLYEAVNEMDDEQYENLSNLLDKQSFSDSVDVVLWLEG